MEELKHWTYAYYPDKSELYYMAHKSEDDRNYYYGLLRSSDARKIGKTIIQLTRSRLVSALTDEFPGVKLIQGTYLFFLQEN